MVEGSPNYFVFFFFNEENSLLPKFDFIHTTFELSLKKSLHISTKGLNL